MRLSRWVLVTLLWLLCVGAVGGGAWYAIDSAGRQVAVLAGNRVTSPKPSSSSQDGGTPVVPGQDAPSDPSGDGSDEPTTTEPTGGTSKGRPTPDAEPTDDPSDGSSSTTTAPQPGSRTTTTAPPRSSRTTTTTEPSTSTSSRTASPTTDAPQARTKTAFTDGGTVVVTCQVGAPLDYGVNPAQGWSAGDHASGDQDVSVKFRRSGRTIEVHATCVDGVPKISVDESDHENDD